MTRIWSAREVLKGMSVLTSSPRQPSEDLGHEGQYDVHLVQYLLKGGSVGHVAVVKADCVHEARQYPQGSAAFSYSPSMTDQWRVSS